MGVAEIIIGVIAGIVAIAIIGVVVLQQGRRAGINGAISGGADTFLSKNKARAWDEKLPRLTRILAIVFFVLVIVANVISLNK